MKNSWKWKIIGVLVAICSLCLFAGCQTKETISDKKDKLNLVAEITYHTNLQEATIGDTYVTQKTLYYRENSPALPLVHSSETSSVTVGKTNVTLNYNNNKYKLLGWYEPVYDDKGNVQKDDKEQVILKDTPFDFSNRLQKDDNYNIYAKWERLEVVVVKLVCDENAVLYSANKDDTKAYRNGDEIKDYAFDSKGERKYPTVSFAVKDDEYTFTEFYKTSDVSNPANMMRQDGDCWPISKTEGQDTVIYAHYIKGDYTVLKTPAGVNTFFRNAGKTDSYYLLYDIDCSSLKNPIAPVSKFNAKLYGNGYTISNISIAKTGIKQDVSWLGDVSEDALLKDVTFKNVTTSYTTDGKTTGIVQIFWLFTSCANANAFNGVTFTNIAMEVTKKNPATTLGNLYIGNTPVKTHCLYGGVTSDAEFDAKGITYTSPLTVKVDGTEI